MSEMIQRIENALYGCLPDKNCREGVLIDAMRYSL